MVNPFTLAKIDAGKTKINFDKCNKTEAPKLYFRHIYGIVELRTIDKIAQNKLHQAFIPKSNRRKTKRFIC